MGVGLFRSEFLFMNRGGDLPGEDEQFEAYARRCSDERLPVTIRTVDIGADKPLDRMSVNELRHEHALNPALGLRAIRWSLSEPAMFRQQLRAILRAARTARCGCWCRWWRTQRDSRRRWKLLARAQAAAARARRRLPMSKSGR